MDPDVAALLAELDEHKACRLLDRLGARAVRREFERLSAINFAVDLQRDRLPRRTIVERLRTRYGFKERKAYMIADVALEQFCKRERGIANCSGSIEPASFDSQKDNDG